MARKRKRDLEPRQRAFIKEYVKDLNAKQAAIRAGYSKTSASKQGYKLLRNPRIIAKLKSYDINISNPEADDETAIATIEEIMEMATEVARGRSKSNTVVIEQKGRGKSEAREFLKSPDEKERLEAMRLMLKYYDVLQGKSTLTRSVDAFISALGSAEGIWDDTD